jgi:hypothetical protein
MLGMLQFIPKNGGKAGLPSVMTIMQLTITCFKSPKGLFLPSTTDL